MAETSPEIVIKQLTEKNYAQAGRLMALEHEIFMINKYLKSQGRKGDFKYWRKLRLEKGKFMNEKVEVIETKEEEDNVVVPIKPQLQIITGGKDGTGNWLKDLRVGAVFLARPKNMVQNFMLAAYQKTGQTERSVQMMEVESGKEFSVDPIRFVGQMEKYEDLGLNNEEEE